MTSDRPGSSHPPIAVRSTTPEDFPGIIALTRLVYPDVGPWDARQLAKHLEVFPEGQLTAVDESNGEIVGMAASLVIRWDDYDITDSWRDFTDHGWFTNHDPEEGRTLYGAEIMVDPRRQRQGIGSTIYAAREALVRRLELRRIRAGARLRGYARHADKMTVREYVAAVVRGDLHDPTLCFQLRHGFRVIGVVEDYLGHDPESHGHAAVIEWLNPELVGEDVRHAADAAAGQFEGGPRDAAPS